MTPTEKQLIESVKKALYEESRKYSTAQERNLISIFHQAVAEERKRIDLSLLETLRNSRVDVHEKGRIVLFIHEAFSSLKDITTKKEKI